MAMIDSLTSPPQLGTWPGSGTGLPVASHGAKDKRVAKLGGGYRECPGGAS